MLECMGWDGSMVAHGGLPPVCNEILQDRAGEQTPSQTRVSLGQADPHENSGVWKQMQRTAVEIGVQTVGIETLVTEADLEFDLEWDPAIGSLRRTVLHSGLTAADPMLI